MDDILITIPEKKRYPPVFEYANSLNSNQNFQFSYIKL